MKMCTFGWLCNEHTGLAKVAVQCSADTFVVNQSLVLRINICGENRHLRQAQNVCDLNNNVVVDALKQMRVGLSVTTFRSSYYLSEADARIQKKNNK